MISTRVDGQTSAPDAEVTIDGRTTRQQIDGFGAAFAWQAPYLKDFPEPGRTAILDTLFSQQTGAGFSIVRSMVNCSSDRTYPEFMSIQPSEGVWEFDHDTGQIWLMQQAQQRGATRFFSSVWSPPGWMKTNGSCINVTLPGIQMPRRPPIPIRSLIAPNAEPVDSKGRLEASKRQAYADYLSRYVREYKARFGIEMYAISIANEPELSIWYDSALWSDEDFQVFIRDYLVPTFARDGVHARIIIPETGSWGDVAAYSDLATEDRDAAAGVQIIAGHHYAGTVAPLAKQLVAGRRVWQTEVSNIGTDEDTISDTLRWARDIHDFMTVAESNAWLWWWGGVSYESGVNYAGGEGLVYFKAADQSYRVAKRLYGIGNYSRFVRPGYLRLAADAHPAQDVYVSAYKDPATQRFVAVAINSGTVAQTVQFTVDHLPLRAVAPYVTSAESNLAPQPVLPVANGVFTATLAPQSVTSFVSANMPDLYVLEQPQAASNPLLRILGSDDSFKTALENQPTRLPTLGDLSGWSFALADANNDGLLDLYAIGAANTTSGRAELHILNGATSFRSFLSHASLSLPTGNSNWSFVVGDANGDGTPDVYAINATSTNSGKAEVHVIDGSKSFGVFLGHYGIDLPASSTSTWRFALADANGDGHPDLYVIGLGANAQASIRIYDGFDSYQSLLTASPIVLPLTYGTNWRFALADANGDGKPDLYAIDTNGGTTGAPTLRIFDGKTDFQTQLTALPIQLSLSVDLARVFLVGRR